MKKLKNYEIIITDDGSSTYFSKLYNEACHSTSGAIEETNLHYIKGCKIYERSMRSTAINILEIGFGTGLGFFETLKTTSMNGTFLNFISTEIDHELALHILDEHNIVFERKDTYIQAQDKSYNLIILTGNARESIKHISSIFNEKFHAIYQDAFSPKRNAILWTTQWFEDLISLVQPDCILSTYSSSSSIRKSMIDAGWKLYKGDKFGPKKSSTRARVHGQTEPEILEHLMRSPVHAITDENYLEYNMEKRNEKN